MFRNATFAGDWTALVDRLDFAETRRAVLAEFRPGSRPHQAPIKEVLLAPRSPAWEDTRWVAALRAPGRARTSTWSTFSGAQCARVWTLTGWPC